MRASQEAAPVPIETLCQDMGGVNILKLDPRPATGEHGGLLVDFKTLDGNRECSPKSSRNNVIPRKISSDKNL